VVGIVLPDNLGAAGDVPCDDILDAAAAAWSAHRIAKDMAASLPDLSPREINVLQACTRAFPAKR
jgi:hypothetical protein